MKTFIRTGLFGLTAMGLTVANVTLVSPAQAQSSGGTITGAAFVDSNANGKRDAGESPLFARYKVTNGGSFWDCKATSGSGNFTYGLTEPGTYFVLPIAGPGYFPSVPVIRVQARTGATTQVDLPFGQNPLAVADQCGAYSPKRTARVPLGIPEAVVGAGLVTLSSAIDQAGMNETLSSAGPFTVFAPNDLAFAKIPGADLDAIFKDKDLLKSILTYHVVEGRVSANDVVNSDTLTTVNGKPLSIRVDEATGDVFVNDALVTTTDIQTANGVLHLIDSVLLP
jgi:hypothetical protein